MNTPTLIRMALVLGITLTPVFTHAYERTLTCTPSGVTACTADETPKGVFWPTRRVEYLIEAKGSPDFGSSLTPALRQGINDSFDAWNNAGCSDMLFVEAGTSARSEIGIQCGDDGENQSINLILWPEDWDKSSSIFALTSVTYNVLDGVIVDADIEFNEEYTYSISPTPSMNEVSVQNTLTHEVGHFLGLDHESGIKESTMFGFAPEGEIIKATLHPDDIEGICAIYPTGGGITLDAPQNICPQTTGCCAQVTGTQPDSAPVLLSLVGVLGLMCLRRRRP